MSLQQARELDPASDAVMLCVYNADARGVWVSVRAPQILVTVGCLRTTVDIEAPSKQSCVAKVWNRSGGKRDKRMIKQ